MHIRSSQSQSRTAELWRSFMPRRKEITDAVGNELYSIRFFDAHMDFSQFAPDILFDEWAAVEVNGTGAIPEGMHSVSPGAGLYAVFILKGPLREAESKFRYIYADWLPASAYVVDNRRGHFAVMGEKYNPGSSDSEEEVWIPIAAKE